MVTVFNPTETLKRPSAVLLFKTSFFPYPGAPSSHSGLVCSFSCGFVGARTSSRALWRVWTCLGARAGMFQRLLSTARARGMKGIGGAERQFNI